MIIHELYNQKLIKNQAADNYIIKNKIKNQNLFLMLNNPSKNKHLTIYLINNNTVYPYKNIIINQILSI